MELGLTFDPPRGLRPDAGREAFLAGNVLDSERLLAVVRALYDGEVPDYYPALRLAIEVTGARGGALGEWNGEAEPRMLALSGFLGTIVGHPALFGFFGSVLQESRRRVVVATHVVPDDPPIFCCALGRPGADLLPSVLCGPRDTEKAGPALEAVLLLIDHSRFRPSATRDPVAVPLAPIELPPSVVRCVSAAMVTVYRQVGEIGPLDVPVLVLGETGVGKEHVVRAFHAASPRAAGPLVAVNCAALPADLLEAEMFGVVGGAATGVRERPGRFKEAEDGTLFLDEIGEMPMALQAKLLRALESGEVQPLGGRVARANVRVVAATNADLGKLVELGGFRRDLYYRIAAAEIRVPPLRERREDIPLLVRHLVLAMGPEVGRYVAGITVDALDRLVAHDWPGNVRELAHELRRVLFATPLGGIVEPAMLFRQSLATEGRERETCPPAMPRSLRIREHVAAIEVDLIRRAFAASRGQVAGAARLLGVSRNGLLLKARRLGLSLPPLDASTSGTR